MSFSTISFNEFNVRIYNLWENQWLLLTSGDWITGHSNSMTVAWGSLGIMWNKPFAQVVVRPTRYTYSFMEKYDTFTLCAFPKQYKRALQLLGSKSGRNCDKIRQSGLTLIPSSQVEAPSLAEANLILECRKIYWTDFDPSHFIDPNIDKNYPGKDYHRIYFGEIVVILQSL